MAHRKPLGTRFTSTFDWNGQLPEPEDYLVSAAGTWYLVVGVIEKANPAKVGLCLERIASRTMIEVREEDAVGRHAVHPFHWYPRG